MIWPGGSRGILMLAFNSHGFAAYAIAPHFSMHTSKRQQTSCQGPGLQHVQLDNMGVGTAVAVHAGSTYARHDVLPRAFQLFVQARIVPVSNKTCASILRKNSTPILSTYVWQLNNGQGCSTSRALAHCYINDLTIGAAMAAQV